MDVGIVLGIVGIFIAGISYFVPWSKLKEFFNQENIDDFHEKQKLRNNYKIAIIDDEIESFPIKFIKKMGFEVECFESISFADTLKITKYDLVFLDVKGVVKEDHEEGGAKFIQILKQARELLPVVAVSSGKFQPELNSYFTISDTIINKPINEFKIREILEELKGDFFDFEKLKNTLKDKIRKLPIEKKEKKLLEITIVKYLSTKIPKDETMKVIHKIATVDSKEIIETANIMKDRIDHD